MIKVGKNMNSYELETCYENGEIQTKKLSDYEFDVFENSEVKKVKLSDYSGKWIVMLFYPADFTFICPTALEEAAESYSRIKELGAEVISVSTDTAFVHKAWHDTSKSINKIKFPMAADPTGNLCRAFGTYIDEEGLSLRGSFIIGPDGTLKSYEIHDNSIGRNIKEIIRKLDASIFVSKNSGQVCPANWERGKKTLKPNMDLVGKI